MEIHDNVKIKVLEVKKLPTVHGVPPTSFVEILVADMKRATRDIPNECNPKYGDSPLIFERILISGAQAILAYINHRDITTGKTICIGVAVIPMETFYQAPKVSIDYWYPIQPPPVNDEDKEKLIQKAVEEGHPASSRSGGGHLGHGIALDTISESRIRLEIEYDNAVDEGVLLTTEEELIPPNLIQVTITKAELPIYLEGYVQVQIGNLRQHTEVK
jgi:hypothetical protein